MAVNSIPDTHNLVICANVFVTKGDKVLMLRRSLEKSFFPGYVQPVGGKVDLNEDPLTAAKRELFEEAGITVRNIRLKAVVTEVKNAKDDTYTVNWQIFQFVGEYASGELGSTDEGELLWLTREELKQEKLADSIAALIDTILDPDAGVAFAAFSYGESNRLIEKTIEIA